MSTATKGLIGVIVAAVAVPAAAYMIPEPTGQTLDPITYHSSVAVTFMFSTLYAGSAALFLLGLKDFKPRLKHAYFIICLGLTLVGLNYIQYPVIGIILDKWHSTWFMLGLANLVFVGGATAMFWGVRRFAKTLQVDSSWSSAILITVLLALTGTVAYSVANVTGKSLSIFDLTLATEAMVAAPFLCSALLTLAIKRIAGPAYTSALAWFFIATIVSALATIPPVAFDLAGQEKNALLAIPSVLTGILFIKAAYAFNKISSY